MKTSIVVLLLAALTPISSMSQERITLRNGSRTIQLSYSEIETIINRKGAVANFDDTKELFYSFKDGMYGNSFWLKSIERCVKWPIDTIQGTYDSSFDPKIIIYLIPPERIKMVLLDFSSSENVKIAVITPQDELFTTNKVISGKWQNLVSQDFIKTIKGNTVRELKKIPPY